jgi:hypothetical protein
MTGNAALKVANTFARMSLHQRLGNVFQQRNTYILRHVLTRLTRRVPLVEQKLLTVPEHLSSPPVFSRSGKTRDYKIGICQLLLR